MPDSASAAVDTEKFRLRRFIERLDDEGEVETHDENVALADISKIVEASDKAVRFKSAGPEKQELVANVMGSRKRLAVALETTVEEVVPAFQARLNNKQPVVHVDRDRAPAQQVVLEGDDADLTKLPFHPQHAFDGSTYISSAIDYAFDVDNDVTNVGCRRLSLRNKRECGTNVTAPSDLQRIYRAAVRRGEKLPISFALGSHPIDFMAAGMRIPADEITLVGTLRGEPVPLVKSLTNDIMVPADAEMVVEGYLDERGYVEPEGPYGEYVGYYGAMHMDPVFHVTAITHRDDVLHQTLLHGSGKSLAKVESAAMMSIRLEAQIWGMLKAARVDVRAVHVPQSGAEGQQIRIAINQQRPGQARNVISTLLGGVFSAKHVFVTDADVDIRSQDEMDWAMASRFQADRDIIVMTGIMGMPMDPSLETDGPTGAKAGFDLTMPMSKKGSLMATVSGAPDLQGSARYQTVEQALEAGPIYFTEIMEALGSRDGREIALELDALRQAGRLVRDENGRYLLGSADSGATGLTDEAHWHATEGDPNRHVSTDKITITR